jgi:multidrug efflux pump subunit AcrA (membrane-fusion protein)
MSQAELESKQARTGQTQASTDLTQARAASAQVDAQYAAQRQQARIAEMRARAAQGDAESERKLAEVDVLLGLTPEEAKTAKTQRETERKSRSTEPAPSSQQSQSGSPDEREAFIRSLAAEAGIEMEDTGNIKNDVMSTIKRLDGAKGMLANTQRNKWLGILAKAEQKYR